MRGQRQLAFMTRLTQRAAKASQKARLQHPQLAHLVWVEGLGGRLDLGLLAKVGFRVLGLAGSQGSQVDAGHQLDGGALRRGRQEAGGSARHSGLHVTSNASRNGGLRRE